MIYKKIIVIFLLILSIFSVFSFSSVHAENINVATSSTERMKLDIDCLKQVLKDNNINNIRELLSFLGVDNVWDISYVFVEGSGHTDIKYQFAYFYGSLTNLASGDNYSYYGVQQNSFSVLCHYKLRWNVVNGKGLTSINELNTLTAPVCWFLVRTADLFTKDSSQIVANAVGNVNNSVNTLNEKLTEDNSNQDDINLGTHNDEMNNASDTIKSSGLFSRFHNYLVDQMNEAFTYNDDEVSTIPISVYGKDYVLRSDEISSFFKNNNLYFVIVLWQSILWFSLLYTMFLFVRKLYKAFAGGNPVDEVSSTLSQEDNKIVGGF